MTTESARSEANPSDDLPHWNHLEGAIIDGCPGCLSPDALPPNVPMVKKNVDGSFTFSAKALDQLSILRDSDGWCEVCQNEVEEDESCSDGCVVNAYRAVFNAK